MNRGSVVALTLLFSCLGSPVLQHAWLMKEKIKVNMLAKKAILYLALPRCMLKKSHRLLTSYAPINVKPLLPQYEQGGDKVEI